MDAVHSIADEREKKVTDKVIEALYESPEKFLAGIEIEKSMKKAKVRLIRQVRQRGKTVVAVIHDLNLALYHIDRPLSISFCSVQIHYTKQL